MDEHVPQNLDELLAQVHDTDAGPSASRLSAITELGKRLPQMTDPRGLIALVTLVKDEPHPKVVSHTINVLSRANATGSVMTFVDVAMGTGIAVFDEPESAEFTHSDDAIKLRTTAIRVLGRLQDERAIIPLMSILNNKSENYRVRLTAAESLGRLGDHHAVTPLLDIVVDEREKSAYLKESAVKALGMLGDLRAMEAIIDEMEAKKGFLNKFKFLKEQLFEAVGRIGQPSAKITETLKAALQDDAPTIRMAAVEALGSLGDEDSMAVLTPMVFDRNDEVARAAVEAIYHIGGKPALEQLLELENLPKLLRDVAFNCFLEEGTDDDDPDW